MPERATNAFVLSLALHIGVVLAIVTLAFVAQQGRPTPVQVFELVAGPPTDLTATEAPALGTPEGQLEVKIHDIPVNSTPAEESEPMLKPEPTAKPEPTVKPEPITKPEAPVKVEKTPTETAPAVTTPSVRPDKKAADKAPASKNSSKTGPIISYKEFVKKHGTPTPSKSTTSGSSRGGMKAPQLKTHGIPDGVVGGSSRSHGGGGGKALTAAEHSAFDAYTRRLEIVLKQNHQEPPGLSELLSADVECSIAGDGTIYSVRVVRSSGNASFDQSWVETFIRVSSIGPTPDGKSGKWTIKCSIRDLD
jgi:TonB family protein